MPPSRFIRLLKIRSQLAVTLFGRVSGRVQIESGSLKIETIHRIPEKPRNMVLGAPKLRPTFVVKKSFEQETRDSLRSPRPPWTPMRSAPDLCRPLKSSAIYCARNRLEPSGGVLSSSVRSTQLLWLGQPWLPALEACISRRTSVVSFALRRSRCPMGRRPRRHLPILPSWQCVRCAATCSRRSHSGTTRTHRLLPGISLE